MYTLDASNHNSLPYVCIVQLSFQDIGKFDFLFLFLVRFVFVFAGVQLYNRHFVSVSQSVHSDFSE